MRFLRYKTLKSVMGSGRAGPGREYSDFSLKYERTRSARCARSLVIMCYILYTLLWQKLLLKTPKHAALQKSVLEPPMYETITLANIKISTWNFAYWYLHLCYISGTCRGFLIFWKFKQIYAVDRKIIFKNDISKPKLWTFEIAMWSDFLHAFWTKRQLLRR